MAYKIKLLVLGPVATNCYLLYNEDTKESLIVDPADRADVIEQFINDKQLHLKAILLTHGHFDHIGAASQLCETYNIKIYGHKSEEDVISNPQINLSSVMGRTQLSLHLDEKLEDKQNLNLIGLNIHVIHTPGHTAGGVCYYIASEGILFSGDTLFACSVGRTDFPGGSSSMLTAAIRDKLFVLPDDTKVFTGHGEQTSIKYEKMYNPFIN